jgi:hypothetical protein
MTSSEIAHPAAERGVQRRAAGPSSGPTPLRPRGSRYLASHSAFLKPKHQPKLKEGPLKSLLFAIPRRAISTYVKVTPLAARGPDWIETRAMGLGPRIFRETFRDRLFLGFADQRRRLATTSATPAARRSQAVRERRKRSPSPAPARRPIARPCMPAAHRARHDVS